MDDVRRRVLDEIEEVLGHYSRSVRIDFEAAEAWMAWHAMAKAVQSGAISGSGLDELSTRARRIGGMAAAA